MKSIYLFRHGKSDWDAGARTDAERPLSKRGQRAARAMGEWFAGFEPAPDRIVCSSAVRTRETLRLAADAAGWTVPVEVTDALYEAPWEAYLHAVRAQDDAIARVLLVGHEPTCSTVLSELTGAEARFPTAAMARIDTDADRWADVAPAGGSLIWLLPPRAKAASSTPL